MLLAYGETGGACSSGGLTECGPTLQVSWPCTAPAALLVAEGFKPCAACGTAGLAAVV